jgi:lipoprotein-anchoring transpeptidase ErfK/SrfK
MHIQISISAQLLTLLDGEETIKQYLISTAKNGAGEEMDSECTPRGKHIVSEKIGADCEPNSVFIGRMPTGEIYEPALRELHPERDWILTRILWLSGEEQGKNKGQNKGKNLDSHDRYIYIHGTPDDVLMGRPGSRGCIRMRNAEIIELFELVDVGTEVIICEK